MSAAPKLHKPAVEFASEAFGGKTAQATFIALLVKGFWPVAIYPKGAIRDGRDPSEGKDPIGAKWGVERWTLERANTAFNRFRTIGAGPGVGICLGPARGPTGRGWRTWKATARKPRNHGPSYSGARRSPPSAGHQPGAFTGPLSLDAERIKDLLPRLKSWESRDQNQSGVYKSDQLPGLELRLGGYKSGGEPKQLQSVVPPTLGTDGQPRVWVGPSTVADAPEQFYMALERLASEPKPKPSLFSGTARGPSLVVTAIGSPDEDREARRITNYVTMALADEAAKVAGTPIGHRHDAMRAASMNMAGLIKGANFPEDVCRRVLAEAADACGLPQGDAIELIKRRWRRPSRRDWPGRKPGGPRPTRPSGTGIMPATVITRQTVRLKIQARKTPGRRQTWMSGSKPKSRRTGSLVSSETSRCSPSYPGFKNATPESMAPS